MHYNKLIKLANYLKLNGSITAYYDLLKLAGSDKFISMVLGSYPSRAVGGEAEMPMRRRIVAKMINNPAETEATIEAMAEVINKDSAIKAEDHVSIWKDYLSPEQITGLLKLVSVQRESDSSSARSSYPGSGYGSTSSFSLDSLYEKLNALKRYHSSVKLAAMHMSNSPWRIVRSSGESVLGEFRAYNYSDKHVRFRVGVDPRGWNAEKDISISNLLSSNRENPNISEASIAAARWLNENAAYGLSVPRSAGGYYKGCLVSDINLYSGRIVLTVSFLVGEDLTSAIKEIDITSYNLDQFVQNNYAVLSSF